MDEITHYEQRGRLTILNYDCTTTTMEVWAMRNMDGRTFSTRKVGGRRWTHAGHLTNVVSFTPTR